MKALRYSTSALLLALAACATVSPKAELRWAGLYTVDSSSEITDPTSLSGTRARSSGVRPVSATTHIPAVLGTHFGFSYVLSGVENRAIAVRIVWRFPEGGIENPSTGKSAQYIEAKLSCPVGELCWVSWVFDHDWELKPGTWTAEVWDGSTLLQSRTFEVYRP
jgi:hypothetical protein